MKDWANYIIQKSIELDVSLHTIDKGKTFTLIFEKDFQHYKYKKK